MASNNPSFMAGVPELVILRLLSTREMYGYEIARAVRLASADTLVLGEGVLYPALHAMEARGLVRTRTSRAEGRIRIYYSLTAKGKARLARLMLEWRRLSQSVDTVLGGETFG